MYGLEAITAHNGWAQALTGAIIVVLGLTILATVISFLPKLVALFEGGKADINPNPTPVSQKETEYHPVNIPHITPLQDIEETAKFYAETVTSLGESFLLNDVYRVFQEKNLPHPHLTIKSLREAGIISPVGDGLFVFKLSSE